MEKVNVYIDGPNLLGAISETIGRRIWIDPYELILSLVSRNQILNKIYYAETPYPEDVFSKEVFRRQQSFFGFMHKYIKESKIIHIQGSYRITWEQVPLKIVETIKPELQDLVRAIRWKRPVEKGGDVGLAVRIVRGAFQNEYDHAFVVTEDKDFAPALNLASAHVKR